jgi:large subunit ribosomal protein L6
MKNFLKRYLIKIPNYISVFYCEQKQTFLIQGPVRKKLLILKIQIEVLKDEKLIKVTDQSFINYSNKEKKTIKSLRGTTVALIKQAFLEVSATMCKKLNLKGVGYKVFPVEDATVNLIHFKLGYSHSIYLKIPQSLTIQCHKSDKIFVFGDDYKLVSHTAALIRNCKIPEPYKGKGISYSNEIIKLKEGKKV